MRRDRDDCFGRNPGTRSVTCETLALPMAKEASRKPALGRALVVQRERERGPGSDARSLANPAVLRLWVRLPARPRSADASQVCELSLVCAVRVHHPYLWSVGWVASSCIPVKHNLSPVRGEGGGTVHAVGVVAESVDGTATGDPGWVRTVGIHCNHTATAISRKHNPPSVWGKGRTVHAKCIGWQRQLAAVGTVDIYKPQLTSWPFMNVVDGL